MSKQTLCIFWKGSWKARAFWYQRGKICSPFYLQVLEVRSEDAKKNFNDCVRHWIYKEHAILIARIHDDELERFWIAANGNVSKFISSVKKTVRWRESYHFLLQPELKEWIHLVFWHGYDAQRHPTLIIRLGLAYSILVASDRSRFSQAVGMHSYFCLMNGGRWRITFSICKWTKYDFVTFLQMANSEVLRLILAKTCNMHLLIEQQWQLGEKKFCASHHLFFHWPQDMKETQFWDWYIAKFLQGLIIMHSSHFHPWAQFHRWSMVCCTCWVRRMHASLWW